jgi:hypothetical protein
MSILENKIITALLQINEIGDTPRGQEFINKSVAKRLSQIHTMNKLAPTYTAKYDLGKEANLAVVRGARQVDRVNAYMKGREDRKELVKQNKWSKKVKDNIVNRAGPTFYRLEKASRTSVDDNMDREPSRGPIGKQMRRAIRTAKRKK